jgi:penicillin V acylase-like amidase (Ntn superfamily)
MKRPPKTASVRITAKIAVLTVLAIGPWELAPPPSACTTFCLADGTSVVFGRNYDWNVDDGLIMVNKRGVAKVSGFGSRGAAETPARWESRYGSVTFNQYGREFPTGGMNEKGLVVELMWLDETVYPRRDSRPAVGVLEWIQYQLDRYASVREVLSHVEEIRITGEVPLHYLVADRSGAAATIEFLEGRLKTHEGKTLPVPVLTNDTYERSLASLSRYQGFGGDATPPSGSGSLARFARTAALVKSEATQGGKPISEYAFDILESAAQGDHTRWSIVYEPSALRIRFRTWNHKDIRSLALSSFDFSCSTPVKILDVTAPLQGDVAGQFTDYSLASNLELIAGSYRQVPFLANVPRSEIEAVARHPDGMSCTTRAAH